MFDHVGIVFRELKSSGAFYRRVLEVRPPAGATSRYPFDCNLPEN